MPKKDKRIDAYIAKSQPFAQPILKKLRGLIHTANPQVEETMKWGMPFFDYKGPYCNMAAFKQHAVLRFWKYQLIQDSKGYMQNLSSKGGTAMGNLGRITSLKDLPPDKVLMDFLKQAKALNDGGIKPASVKKQSKGNLVIPIYFITAVKKNKKALSVFQNFSTSCKREYVEWVTGAKTKDTRNSRLETAVQWIEQGKKRNWKYHKT